MKQFLIFLFIMTFPVSAGNEPAPETEKDTAEYAESGQTLEVYKNAEESVRMKGRRVGRNLGILGIAAVGTGIAVYHQYDKWSGVEISLIGVGVTAVGCYAAFINRKKL